MPSAGRSLHIAWLGSVPLETGGAPGVAAELLEGLADLGHRIDCFLPGAGRNLPQRLADNANLTFVWGRTSWRWNAWYNRTQVTTFISGLISRGLTSIRLRRAVVSRHRSDPYNLILQASSIESLGVPRKLLRTVPLVIRPDSHQAGELRWLLREWRLALRCQPPYVFALVAAVMTLRTLVQVRAIRRASLLICLSSVFRDHIVRDYRFPLERTVIVTNPVRLQRFPLSERGVGDPMTVIVPGRVSLRKGIEDVVALSRVLLRRGVDARIRVVGGPSLWSDYRKLLEDMPHENSEYVEKVPPTEMPTEYAASDVMLQASKYDPCPMAVIESLASGVPVVATNEVGSIEAVDRSVVIEVPPADVEGLADAIEEMLSRLRADPAAVRRTARAEAERRFATPVVCAQISEALERLVASPTGAAAENGAGARAQPDRVVRG
jgi:glycosyltransferase involved in cell wall biosynthesis